MKKNITLIIFILLGLIAGCQNCRKGQPRELIHIAALNNPRAIGNIAPLRLKFLTETATLVGAQGGLAWRSEQINCVLRRQQTQLDNIYNFRALMLKDDIKPPVLEEGRQELTQDSCEVIRAADQIYRLVRPPCFVTAPPNWREYIWMKFCQPEPPDVTLLPKNTDEGAVWNCYVNIGWQQGIEQANQIFAENLSRLKRDYSGMVLYRKLLAQNMVTPPYVSKTELGVTGNGDEIRINDRILTISSTSKLNPNPDTWKPVVAKTGPGEVCCPVRDKPPQRCATIIRNTP
ncbi:MAG: type IV secretory system conjugative DNA transfer family protein [Gammaproteobacteria bacterium]|nr:type IV secretory system conjugative DNA transfer family protein [Gammaproteobacteria bacterium]